MIGPGETRREGWQTLDAHPAGGWDYVASIPPLPPGVKQFSWDEIEWIHGITSLYPWDAAAVAVEIRNVLAPGGKLTLEQPNFNKAMFRPDWLFGDPAFKEPLHMNRWTYTPESLSAMLAQAGFNRIDVVPAQHHIPERDFRIEAYAR